MLSLRDDTGLGESPVVDNPTCRLLGPTALIVQGVMGVLVIMSLVLKRHRESPKRPWRIWLFDVAKQVFGQMFVHGVNVGLSDILQRISDGNACIFYFLNILIDTTLGVGVIYVTLHALTNLLTDKLHLAGFTSGQYGSPPSVNYWFRQATVYVLAITTMKLVVVALFAVWPGIFGVGQWLLSWTGDGSNFQIIFVMGVFPVAMNILQFWLIDSIVKASTPPSNVALPSDTPRDSSALDREPLFRASTDDEDDDEDSPSRPHDIENPPPRSYSPLSDVPATGKSADTTDEHKSSGTVTPATRNGGGSSFASHAYPPRSTPFAPVANAPDENTPTSAESLSSKRRSPPPQLQPRSPLQPAVNSPMVTSEHVKQSVAPQHLGASKIAGVGKVSTRKQEAQETKDWDSSWEDSDDWAERVGEEDWTGRRVEAAKGFVGNIWDNATPAIRVG